jgi:hypothetical protein
MKRAGRLLRRPFRPLEKDEKVRFRLKVHGRKFAAPVDLELELESVAFVERRNSGALDSGDVNEGIRLAVIALDEAEALHGIEELDRATGLFAGQLALRAASAAGRTRAAAAAALDRHRLAFDAKVGGRHPTAAIDQREFERLAIGEVGETGLLDRRDVHEHILAAIVTNDEAEALLRIEEFDDALAFANDLRGHSATAAATKTAAATAATAAAAEATAPTAAAVTATAAATIAVATAAAAEAAAPAAVAAALLKSDVTRRFIAEETVALVTAAPAAVPLAPFIETHACQTSVVPQLHKTNALGPRRNRS